MKLQKARDILVKNLPAADGAAVTSFGTCRGGFFPTIQLQLHAHCLASIANDIHNGSETLFIWHAPKSRKEVNDAWLEFLVGKDSPWKMLIEGQSEQKREFVYRYGFVLDNLDYPSNLVVNFLTAFRLTQEYPSLAECWYRLRNDGVSRGASVIACGMVTGYNTETGISTGRRNSGHYAWNAEYLTKDTVRRINESDPDSRTFLESFRKSTRYSPCNVIWGWDEKVNIYDRFIKFTRENSGRVSKVKRLFTDAYPSVLQEDNQVEYEGLLAFARAVDAGTFL